MKIMLLIDTNILLQQTFQYKTVKELKEKGIDCYVSDLIIRETKSVNYRKIIDEYEALEKILKGNLADLYFTVNNKTKLDEVKKKNEENIDRHINTIFGDNKISFYSSEEMFNTAVERAVSKIPPFADYKSKSDKGFKDTLNWLSLLKFAEDNDYDEYILVTHDKDFRNNETILNEEFQKHKPNAMFQVKKFDSEAEVRKFFKLNEEEKESIKDESPFTDPDVFVKPTEEEIEQVRNTIDDILFNEHWKYDEVYFNNNFHLLQEITDDDVLNFCEVLKDKLNNLLFFDTYDLCKIFDELDIECKTFTTVSVKNLTSYIELYNEIFTNKKYLKDPFIFYIKEQMNEMVMEQTVLTSDDELPF